jgi:putative oxidoreductase
MRTFERYGSFASRIALAAIFIVSGLGTLAGPTGTAAYIASKGLPLPMVAAIAAGILELVGGLMLLIGLRARTAALALAAFLLPATILFHSPLGLTGMEAQMQLIHVLKNLAIMGGLVSVAVWGAGPLSLDGREPRAAQRGVTPVSEARS